MKPSKEQADSVRQETIETVGLRIRQAAEEIDLFLFSVDGKTIAKQLGVRRMKWHAATFKAEDYQRKLDNSRVIDIASYLNKNPILPNAFVVAFEKGTLEFAPLPGQVSGQPEFGLLRINGRLQQKNGQLEGLPEGQRIGYVIDGQHRLKAIEYSTLAEGSFPVVVSAFHDVEPEFQLHQFYTLNQTVPIADDHLALLRRDLKLPTSAKEAHKKAISRITGMLQEMHGSPFKPEEHIGSAIYKGPLKVTVLEGAIGRAIRHTHLAHKWGFVDPSKIPEEDLKEIARTLYIYWKAISVTFPQYWGKKPKDQRLFCAMGLYAMTMFLDKAMEGIDINSAQAVDEVSKFLEPISDLPWDQILLVPSSPKVSFKPEHLFEAVKALWLAKGARPYTFKVEDPSGMELHSIKLP